MAKAKQNKEKLSQNNAQSQRSVSSFPIVKWILLPVIAAFIFFNLSLYTPLYLYELLIISNTAPPLPKLDLQEWLGPYPMDQTEDKSIRPFEIEFSDVMIHDLRERLLHRRPFEPPLKDSGFTYGFNTDFLTQVLDYWQNKYNFKERENFLNKYTHYKTKIQGLDLHYVHVRPTIPNNVKVEVAPLLMLHGWPGSFRDFYELAPKLTALRPSQDFVFELIVPSLPGFGYSQGADRPGFGPLQMAGVLHNLMKRLGFTRYYVHGGDMGHMLAGTMATVFPDEVLGFHTNSPTVVFHPFVPYYLWLGSLWPSLVVQSSLSEHAERIRERFERHLDELRVHTTAKPDTTAIALTDSPAGLTAYILEKYSSVRDSASLDGGLRKRHSLASLLDHVTVYWASHSVAGSFRAYRELLAGIQNLRIDEFPTDVPTWGIKFKHALIFHPDLTLRLKYTNYLHTTAVDDGGQHAALEMPGVLADDLYKAVGTFRQFHGKSGNTPTAVPHKTIYDFEVKDLNGNLVKLDKYKGYVLIVVNVASQCGLTDTNYKELNMLYEKYHERGLRILAFPCNQFGGQEPGDRKEIFHFTKNRGVKFDLFEKVNVNGDAAHPLWQFLKTAQGGTLGDFIKWNFSKFVVDRSGVPVERFGPNVNPLELEQTLDKYW